MSEVVPAFLAGERARQFPDAIPQSRDGRSAALRSRAFGLEKAISIGFRSGEYGGGWTTEAPASIAAPPPATLWEERLSMTTRSPGVGVGTRKSRT